MNYRVSERTGINYFDLYDPEPYIRDNLGKVMKGRRGERDVWRHIDNILT